MRLIDADALKESMRGEFIDHIEEHRAITIIDDAPTVEPKRGEWEEAEQGFYKCSECGCYWNMSLVDNCNVFYCPNCGARMKGASNGTDVD